MPKRIYIIFSFLLIAKITIAQNWKIGAGFGRAYFHYQYKDYGQGYSNASRANYGLTAQISLQKELSNRRFFETGLKFVLYEQYYTKDCLEEPGNKIILLLLFLLFLE